MSCTKLCWGELKLHVQCCTSVGAVAITENQDYNIPTSLRQAFSCLNSGTLTPNRPAAVCISFISVSTSWIFLWICGGDSSTEHTLATCTKAVWIYTVSSTQHTLATKAVWIYYYTVSSTEHTLATCTKAVWIYTVSSTEHTLAAKAVWIYYYTVRTYHVRNILRHTLLCNCSV